MTVPCRETRLIPHAKSMLGYSKFYQHPLQPFNSARNTGTRRKNHLLKEETEEINKLLTSPVLNLD